MAIFVMRIIPIVYVDFYVDDVLLVCRRQLYHSYFIYIISYGRGGHKKSFVYTQSRRMASIRIPSLLSGNKKIFICFGCCQLLRYYCFEVEIICVRECIYIFSLLRNMEKFLLLSIGRRYIMLFYWLLKWKELLPILVLLLLLILGK